MEIGESGGESLQTLFPPQYYILSISGSGAFPHCGYPSLQLDLSLLKYESGGKAEEGRGKWKLRSQRWVVIRNITVIGGLSIHLSCRSVFFDTGEFYEGKLSRQPIKRLFSLSLSLIRGLLIHQQWLALNRPRKPVDEH